MQLQQKKILILELNFCFRLLYQSHLLLYL
nr:MAG TPA: hypothetical protein [Caudoviricetes sp.]